MKHLSLKAIAFVFVFIVTSCGTTKKTTKSKETTATSSSDAKPEKKPNKDAIQPYDKVITKEAKTDEGLFVHHDLTQEELAQLVGASRETVNKALADFAGRNWLKLDGRAVLITDFERLAKRGK